MAVLAIIVLLAAFAAPTSPQIHPVTCSVSRECQQLAFEAADRGDYETFHSLAWRAVQTGAPNDANLMFLLARAQSLSGRPHDALVMLRRLAERGVNVAAAETSDDFRRVRTLQQWPEVLVLIHTATAPHMTPRPADPALTELTAEPKAPERPTTTSRETLRVPAGLEAPFALAYDAVSRRFVFAHRSSDTLKVLDELSGNVVNLVGHRWAGSYRTVALAIDPRRGDLWAAAAHDEHPTGDPQSAVHRLQLVSGRLLYTVALAADAGAARFADLAVANGNVFVLDVEGRRVFGLAPAAKSLRLLMSVDALEAPTSLAPAEDGVIYVAHAEGIVRLNLAARTIVSLGFANTVSLRGLERIGYHNGALVGIQRKDDGSKVVVRIRLDRRGTTATSSQVLDEAASSAASIVGNVLYYLSVEPHGGTIVRRLQLR